MDQIPMPFIIGEDTKIVTEDGKHAHIKGTGVEGLNKQQYTVHLFINVNNNGESAHGYIDMVCRGKGTLITR